MEIPPETWATPPSVNISLLIALNLLIALTTVFRDICSFVLRTVIDAVRKIILVMKVIEAIITVAILAWSQAEQGMYLHSGFRK